jgi:multiple sugar transport system ATP-binding protein
MDEPLSNLDAKLRVQTRSQIAALQRRLGVTTVYVTHDQVEAMTMGDRVAVLKDGVLQQVDTPSYIYDNPANVFVAGFIGSPAMNLFEVGVQGDTMQFGNAHVPLRREAAGAAHRGGDAVTLGVRPEDMTLVGSGEGLRTEITLVESLGADAYVYGAARIGETDHDVIARVDGRTPPKKGDVVEFAPKPEHVHVFSTESGERLPS